MKDIPILFSTEMVKAIQEDRKTHTRRVIKPQPNAGYRIDKVDGKFLVTKEFEDLKPEDELIGIITGEIKCPYGQPGDTLWVRETWFKYGNDYLYRADGEEMLDACASPSGGYPAECRQYPGCEGCTRTSQLIPWKPSIHMPREACRIKLIIKNIRVERLQDISEEDAKAEGVDFCCPSQRHGNWNDRWISGYCDNCKYHDPMTGKRNCHHSIGYEDETRFRWFVGCSGGSFELRDDNIPEPYRFKFSYVWDGLGKPPYWNCNPWVWAIEFEKIL